jgi:hypothetical protein
MISDIPKVNIDDSEREDGELEPGELEPEDEFPPLPPNQPPPQPPSLSTSRRRFDDRHNSDGYYNTGHSLSRQGSHGRMSHGVDYMRESTHRQSHHMMDGGGGGGSYYNRNSLAPPTNMLPHVSQRISPANYPPASRPDSRHSFTSAGGEPGSIQPGRSNAPKRSVSELDNSTGGSGRQSDGKRIRRSQEPIQNRDSEILDARVQEARKELESSAVRRPKTKFGNITLKGSFSIDDFDFTENNRVGAGTFG